jgi:hypothetical protein
MEKLRVRIMQVTITIIKYYITLELQLNDVFFSQFNEFTNLLIQFTINNWLGQVCRIGKRKIKTKPHSDTTEL